ncbi:MAG: hypothetical protein LBE36_09020 [Flavobacteriaceae bacterium]|jgi:RHS repeat-associated protein|nr:hypothetical protein [Flavobacteriaceae bacterium]
MFNLGFHINPLKYRPPGGIPTHGFEFTGSSELTALANALKTEANQLAAAAGNPPIDWGSQSAGNAGNTLETEQMCSEAVLKQVEIFKNENNQICVDKLMNGYIIALNNGKVCEFWHAFQLDNCMINQPTEQLKYQTYWVHPDHLGSSSTITNQNGAATNWYEYMPFGEMLMELTSGDYDNVYKYNGKELDESTGLYYYGARYYDPRTSIWLSVDPLAEKYPNVGAYVYTMNNPIIFIDPTGMATEDTKKPNDWVYNFKTNSIYWNDKATSQATAGGNETYLGKSGTYTTQDGSTTALYSNGSYTNNFLLGELGIMNNLDPLIQAGENGPMMSYMAFGVPSDGSYIRATPNSNSPEYAMSTPSGQLAVAGLYGLQGGTAGITTEFALGKLGLSSGLSWSTTGFSASDGLGGLGVQTSFSSGGISMGQAASMIPTNFSYVGGLNKGEGFKFIDPATKGSSSILLEYGNPASRDVLHSGPYIKINQSGSYIERIPLQGNPVLNIGR